MMTESPQTGREPGDEFVDFELPTPMEASGDDPVAARRRALREHFKDMAEPVTPHQDPFRPDAIDTEEYLDMEFEDDGQSAMQFPIGGLVTIIIVILLAGFGGGLVALAIAAVFAPALISSVGSVAILFIIGAAVGNIVVIPRMRITLGHGGDD